MSCASPPPTAPLCRRSSTVSRTPKPVSPQPTAQSCPIPPPVSPAPQSECKVSPPRKSVDRVRDPTPEPIIKREVKRLPTPPGDVIERVVVRRQPQQIIERVTEQPRKPPPKIVERIENEPAPPPIIRNTCVLVDPTPRPEQSASLNVASTATPKPTSPPPQRVPTPSVKSPTPQPASSCPPEADFCPLPKSPAPSCRPPP